jgi:hypothetical protein
MGSLDRKICKINSLNKLLPVVLSVLFAAIVAAAWFTQTVIADGRQIADRINDKQVSDYTQPKALQRDSGWDGNVLCSGMAAPQGHKPLR